MQKKANMEFLGRFLPVFEFLDVETHKDELNDKLVALENQIRNMPKPGDTAELSADEINVGMHYFGGGIDIWIHEFDPDTFYGSAFVCLNDPINAEAGSIYLPEYYQMNPWLELDLNWDSNTKVSEVMKQVKSQIDMRP